MLSAEYIDEAGDDGRFRLAMASAGIGMGIIDLQARWLEVNPAAEAMFGYSADELIGQQVFALWHPDEFQASRQHMADLVDGTVATLDLHKRYLHKDGHVVHVHLSAAVMRDAAGEPCYFIAQLRDISNEVSARQKLEALTATLEARVAERTTELETLIRQQEVFAYGVTHDLRAPLRSIDSFAGLLETHLANQMDDTGRDYLQRIRGATVRMGGLIDALLELSRAARTELRMAPVDLSLLAEWVCAELADADPQRVTRIQVQPGMQACGDERQIKLLLAQVLGNAWKFSAEREQVEINVSGETTDEGFVLHVRDRGIGFDMAYVDRLFEPFQKLHGPEQASGNGIGMAIAQQIATRHGGTIRAQSEEGAGSTFSIVLPAIGNCGPDVGAHAQ